MEITELDFGLNKYENFSKFIPESSFKFDQIKILYNNQEVGEIIGSCSISTECFNNEFSGFLTGHRITLDSSIFNNGKTTKVFEILINNNILLKNVSFDKGNYFAPKGNKIIIENFIVKFNKMGD